MSVHLEIELLDDLVSTERSATVGGHRCLDYIPGAQLLGAAATVLYAKLSPEDAWRTFHSGEVRFGAGLPVAEGFSQALPMPLSLHVRKGERATDDREFLNVRARNLARGSRQDGAQLTQLRQHHVTTTGRVIKVDRTASLKTAVGANGRARDGFLFQMTTLRAGARFVSRIDADDPALLGPVCDVLTRDGIRLGRSRSAEFGRVRVRRVVPAVGWEEGALEDAMEVVVWCVSDLCLLDCSTAQPTLVPSPEHFRLPGSWRLDLTRSFPRSRRYSPFNSTRRRPDTERQVIVAGSVLVFVGDAAVRLSELREGIRRGVGEHRADGLGRVLVEPAFLASPTLPVQRSVVETKGVRPVLDSLEDPLIDWAEGVVKLEDKRAVALEKAAELLKALAAYKPEQRIPASQWGEVRQIARRFASRKDGLPDALRTFVSNAHRRLERRWGAELGNKSLGEAIVEQLRAIADPPVAALTLDLFAIEMTRKGACS